jgi:GTP diphosphokinase / guanosine-3',5'-bis(diphosphate) 3'-diphosphatase
METKENLMAKFNALLLNYDEKDREIILKAYDFSEINHRDQKRASGEEFVIHPLSVAMILMEMNVDREMVVAGLLHDVVEDTKVTLDDLKNGFGEGVANLVDGVTKISKLKTSNRTIQKSETIRKMLFAMIKDMRVIIVKFADKLHNMRTLNYLPENKIKRIANETLEIYSPLANKMGLYVIKNELENLALKWLFPEIYKAINDFIEKSKIDRERTKSLVTKKILERLNELKIPFTIKSRTKHFYSIYRKMKKYDKKIDEIFDLYGIRIITDTVENCYQIFGAVHRLWQPIPGRFKDYIANPKKNGYKSLHTTVLIEKRKAIEIQIRTEEMDEFNEYGIAAHWFYKKDIESDARELEWLKNLMEVNKQKLSPEEYYQTIRNDILKEEIYVFTPKGDIIELPKGSTPLDFAYRIHTLIGHRCRGAKANGVIIPLYGSLKNGMVVEIITSREPHPKQSWLSIVKTANAKKKIKHYFTTEKQDEIAPEKTEEKHPDKTEKKEDRLPKKPITKKVTGTKITVDIGGEKNLLFNFAKCCKPTPSDRIIGFVSRGRGIIIHREDCDNLKNINGFEERKISVNWSYPNKSNVYSFFVKALKKSSPFSDIGNIVQKYKGQIIDSSVEDNYSTDDKIDGYFSVEFPFDVNIELVLKEARKIPSILFIDKR